MRFFYSFFILVITIFSLLIVPSIFAADTPIEQFAECDICGYCPKNYPTPPGNWGSCVKCVYPTLFEGREPSADIKDTLRIEPTSQNPPTPYPGHLYTMVGCIQTDLSSFRQDGAAASVVQKFLDFLFQIIGGIAILYFMYGSFLVLTSRGDPERLNHGKQTLYASVAGLVFSLLSLLIVQLLANGILRIPGFG